MSFKQKVRKVFSIVGIICLSAAFIILLAAAEKKQSSAVCESVVVSFEQDAHQLFIEEHDIKNILNSTADGELKGKSFSNLQFKDLEEKLRKNPYVSSAEVFANLNGVLHARVDQKISAARVMSGSGSYYITEKGEAFPVSPNFTSREIVVTGKVNQVDENGEEAFRKDLLDFILFVRDEPLLNALIEQIDVDQKGELTLIPKIGDQLILFGDPIERRHEKFNNLLDFYRQADGKIDWENYETINLKFKGQIICKKA